MLFRSRDPVVQNIACAQFVARGIDPDRLVFPEPVIISASDLAPPALDPSSDMVLAPLGGLGLSQTQVLEALCHGIPVLWMTELKAGVPNPLAALGLVEFMASDARDYVQKACDWMNLCIKGDGHRQSVRALFDQSAYRDLLGFVARLELAYRLMFDIWTSKIGRAHV